LPPSMSLISSSELWAASNSGTARASAMPLAGRHCAPGAAALPRWSGQRSIVVTAKRTAGIVAAEAGSSQNFAQPPRRGALDGTCPAGVK
jgi:hypothetical protein